MAVRIQKIILGTFIILLIPFTAMQFTNEVNWSVFDFVIAGILIFAVGLAIELILRKIKTPKLRVASIVAIIIAFLIIWAELAVGIFGSPFAGN